MSYGPAEMDGLPQGLVVLIGEGNPTVWTDISHYVKRESVVITRHKPGEPGRMTFQIWAQGGAYPFVTPLQDLSRVRVYDPYANPGSIYMRYFAGFAITQRIHVENNINLYIDLDCADYNWLWQNPPAMPTIKTLVGAPPVWLPDHQYFAGDEVQAYPTNTHKFTCNVGGTSLHTQPVWNTAAGGTTVELMSAVWTLNHAYRVGDEVRATSGLNTHRFIVFAISGDGKSGGTEPAWVTTTGGTTNDNHVVWHENGSHGVHWYESGSSNVTDVTAINEVLDLYYPQNLMPHTRLGLRNLIASVPSVEIEVTDTPHDVMNKIAEHATSTKYYENPQPWQPAHQYTLNDFISVAAPVAPNYSNGIVFRAIDIRGTGASEGLSGATEPFPGFNSFVDLGATLVDNNVTWISDHRLGKAQINTVYIVGQRIEPQAGAPATGMWYQCIRGGTLGPTYFSTWPLSIGDTILLGVGSLAPIFMCGGPTSSAPIWEWRIPPDNISHDASWNPVAYWVDSNRTDGMGIAELATQYTDITDLTGISNKIHYTDLTLNREGNGYANVYYVFGRNGSFARVPNPGEILNKGGLTVAKAFVDTGDTGPADNSECYAKASELLALAMYGETGQLTAYETLDPVMVQQLTQIRVANNLMGIDPATTFYPVSDASVTFADQIASWAFTIGAPFLTDRESLLSKKRGGRRWPTQGPPPAAVTFGADWILMNVVRPLTRSADVRVQWRSSGEANLERFQIQIEINGNRDWLPPVTYPTQYTTVTDLPLGADIYFYVLPINNQGNYPLDQLGHPYYTKSPLLQTAPLPAAPSPPGYDSLTSIVTPPPYINYSVDIQLSHSGDHSRGGYVTMYASGSPHPLDWVDIPGDATWPVTVHFENLQPLITYAFHAAVQDAYQQWSSENVYDPFNVTPVPIPLAPNMDLFTPGIEGGEGITSFYVDVRVQHPPVSGDHSGGGYVSLYEHGSPHVIGMVDISGAATYPVTVRFHNMVPAAIYDFKAAVFDAYRQISPEDVESSWTFTGPIIPAPGTPVETSNVYNAIDDATQIAFTWTAPTPPTGLTIAGYRIIKIQNGISTPIEIGNALGVSVLFEAGLAYTFTVQAIDNFGHYGLGSSKSGTAAPRAYAFLFNPSFENIERAPQPLNPRGWTLTNNNGTVTWDTSDSSVGARSLKFHFASGASGPTAQSDFFRITELSSYFHTFDAKASAAGGSLNFTIRYYAAARGSPLSTKSVNIPTASTSWAQYSADIGFDPPVPPVGSRFARVTYSIAAPGGPDISLDNLTFEAQIINIAIKEAALSPSKMSDVVAYGAAVNGQVLTADSTAVPTGMKWATPSATDAGAIHATIVDAKGDLIAGTANDAVARLPVGGAGKVLKPDASASTGLKWESPDFSELTGGLSAAQHGSLGGSTLHAVATGLAAGFMANTDKSNLDTVVANYLSKTLIDTKGDLLVGTANDTITRLGPGIDGQSLYSKSADATGLIWLSNGIAWLTNKSGGSVALGDVVVIDKTNDGSFTTTTTSPYADGMVGIAQETIANNAAGAVLLYGVASQVNCNLAITRGHYLKTHTTAKQGASGGTSDAYGAFGQALSGGIGVTSPKAIVWGHPHGPVFLHATGHSLGANDPLPPNAVSTQTGTFTATALFKTYLLNSGSAFTANLPTAVGINGKEYTFININTGLVTMDGNSSETIFGLATYPVPARCRITIVSDGANWQIIDKDGLFSGVNAYKSTNQNSIADSTFTKVTFDTEVYDINSEYSSSTFTCKIPGYYHVLGTILTDGSISAVVGDQYMALIYKNGANIAQGRAFVSYNGLYVMSQVIVPHLSLAAGDTVELYWWQHNFAGSTGNRSIYGSGSAETAFGISKVS